MAESRGRYSPNYRDQIVELIGDGWGDALRGLQGRNPSQVVSPEEVGQKEVKQPALTLTSVRPGGK